jgi:hypothetical protein
VHERRPADARERLVALDALIARLRAEKGLESAQALAEAVEERRVVMREVAEQIRSGEWVPPAYD